MSEIQENLDDSNLDYLQSSEIIDQDPIILALPTKNISVSGLSSILRSIQATIRTVIDSHESNTAFRLIIKDTQAHEMLEFHMAFIAVGKTPDAGNTAVDVFDSFFEALIIATRRSSQRTLFGEKVLRSNKLGAEVPSIQSDRMHEMINELSRFKSVKLSYKYRALLFNRGTVEILD